MPNRSVKKKQIECIFRKCYTDRPWLDRWLTWQILFRCCINFGQNNRRFTERSIASHFLRHSFENWFNILAVPAPSIKFECSHMLLSQCSNTCDLAFSPRCIKHYKPVSSSCSGCSLCVMLEVFIGENLYAWSWFHGGENCTQSDTNHKGKLHHSWWNFWKKKQNKNWKLCFEFLDLDLAAFD